MTIGAQPFGRAPLGGTGANPDVLQQLSLQIGPMDVTPLLLWGTARITKELNGRDELEFTLKTDSGYVPSLGETVILSYQSAPSFVGTVHERDVRFLSEAESTNIVSQVRCVDLNEVADRRIVAEIFENMSTGEIVRQIVEKYLFPEFIMYGDIQEGPLVELMVIPYLTVAQCLDELSEKSGFHWNIASSRHLNFVSRTTSPAPFTITSANAVFRGFQGSRTRNQYRNVQYVDGGKAITDPRSEFFRGDGTIRTFNVEYPVYKEPTVTKNFVVQTVGIRGVDTGKQWYWNLDENAIGQNPDDPVLVSTDVLQVLYSGSFKIIVIVEDAAAILARQSVEVTSTGRYEQLFRDDSIDGQNLVQDKGLSLLKRYDTLDSVIDFETDVSGLDIGQLASVNVPELGITGDHLITRIDIQWIRPETRRYRVTASTGDVKGRFQDFFAQLLGGAKSIKIREGEVLQQVTAMQDFSSVTDSITATLVNVAADDFGVGEFGPGEFGP